MKAHFLVTIEMPDWANKPDPMECIRQEIEQHAGAAAAFYTRATHITATCNRVPMMTTDALLRFVEDGLELRNKP